jgi:hypothetical protein
MCQKHYLRAYRAGEIVVRTHRKRHSRPRIHVRVSGCWEWGGHVQHGRGVVGEKGRNLLAYRWVWEHMRGPISEGNQLHHLCRNRMCVNPAHLREMSPEEHHAAHWAPVPVP